VINLRSTVAKFIMGFQLQYHKTFPRKKMDIWTSISREAYMLVVSINFGCGVVMQLARAI
jgi:hypothetical protein